MKAYDFMYDNRNLSSFGFIICNFGGSKGIETLSNGAEIVFNTVSTFGGKKNELVSTKYESCLECTIQICKGSCTSDVTEISSTELRELSKWLNRNKYLKLKFFDEANIDLYHEATFSINKIEIDGHLYGLELQIKTNRPFALKEPKTIVVKNTLKNGKHYINDTSHEEGYIYPYTEITIAENGDLNIYNALESRNTFIANCVAGEVITMDYPVIRSSLSSHNLQNDFNWNFFRIANTFNNSKNDLIISLPCTIKVKYSPIIKVGL